MKKGQFSCGGILVLHPMRTSYNHLVCLHDVAYGKIMV